MIQTVNFFLLYSFTVFFWCFIGVEANDVSAVEESYSTPNRIHIHLNSNIVIADYVFPDENENDIKDRIKELYNVDIVDSSKQIIYVEDLPRNYNQDWMTSFIMIKYFFEILAEIKSSQSDNLSEKSDILPSSLEFNQNSGASKSSMQKSWAGIVNNCNLI